MLESLGEPVRACSVSLRTASGSVTTLAGPARKLGRRGPRPAARDQFATVILA